MAERIACGCWKNFCGLFRCTLPVGHGGNLHIYVGGPDESDQTWEITR